MDKIKISSTSYLLPNNQAWSELEAVSELSFGNYGNVLNDIINFNEEHLMSIIFIEDIFNDNLVKYKNFIKSYTKLIEKRLKNTTKVMVVGICINYNDDLIETTKKISKEKKLSEKFTKKLYQISNNYNNFFILDLDKEFSRHGFDNIFDYRNWYYAHCRLSSQGLRVISKSISKIFYRYNNTAHKLLALDCDNTIWGGVAGEDGIKGLQLGTDGIGLIYSDFQKIVKKLIKQGIIVSLVSKNNEEDVWSIFRNHKKMILSKSDVVSSKINWNNKSSNIKKIAKELDIGLGSIIFWDDNPLERAQMKRLLPEVQTIDLPDEIYHWPKLLDNLFQFKKFEYTKEDKKKLSQYKSRAKFKKDISVVDDTNDYLKEICLKPKKLNIDKSNLSRAEQLCSKTNQFNLRTKRYSMNEIQTFKKNKDNLIFLSELKDNYGDHGIVGLTILNKINCDIIFLDHFSMSCRILGRNFDSWMLNEIIKISKKHNYRYLVSGIIENKNNIVAKDFFRNHNFEELKETNKIKKLFRNERFKYDKLHFIEILNYKTPNMQAYE